MDTQVSPLYSSFSLLIVSRCLGGDIGRPHEQSIPLPNFYTVMFSTQCCLLNSDFLIIILPTLLVGITSLFTTDLYIYISEQLVIFRVRLSQVWTELCKLAYSVLCFGLECLPRSLSTLVSGQELQRLSFTYTF